MLQCLKQDIDLQIVSYLLFIIGSFIVCAYHLAALATTAAPSGSLAFLGGR